MSAPEPSPETVPEPAPAAAEPPPAPLRRLGPLLVALLLLGLVRATWRTWPDAVIDFGHELYVAWRVSEGDRLYLDIAYHNGPLSPALNGLWFRVWGPSLTALIWLNLFVLAGATALVYALARRLAGELAAVTGSAVFLCMFAAGHFTTTGNYNWLCPYSHEVTHGLALALLALWLGGEALAPSPAGSQASGSRGVGWLAGAGLVLGLCFLTKAEVFLAGAGGLGALVLAGLWGRAWPVGRALGALVAGLLGPPLAAWALLTRYLPAGEALASASGAWRFLLWGGRGPGVRFPFAIHMAGLDEPGRNLAITVAVAVGYAATAALLLAIARWLAARHPAAGATRSWPPRATLGAAAGGGLLLFLLWWFGPGRGPLSGLPRFPFLRGLPLLCLYAGGRELWGLRRRDAPDLDARALRLGLIVLAGLLLGRMLLRVWVGQYGFGLAAPGALLLVLLLLDGRRAGSEPAARALQVGGAALALSVAAGHVMITLRNDQSLFYVVGEDDDAYYADRRGAFLEPARRAISELVAPDETLLSLVNAEVLNYLTRRKSSVRFGIFTPHQLSLYSEDEVLAALEAAPPDWVCLVHNDDSEHGVRFFGQDYAPRLGAFVRGRYRVVKRFGAVPMSGPFFGIELLRRER
ncbi:MAG: hypothetical protein AB7N76_02325 [Planctomycetota bacterium]